MGPRPAWVPPLVALLLLGALGGCNYRHSAPVRATDLPPPPGQRELHSSPLLVEIVAGTDDSQCVAYEDHRTLCFHDVRSALEKALTQGLWPAFPGVRLGRLDAATPSEYVLQVDAHLDALPPDARGPGWSAAVTGRWRLLRDGVVLEEEAIASRSRAEFPYGAALGDAGSEVIDALGVHVITAVSNIEERRPVPARPLPAVLARSIPQAPAQEDPGTPPADAAKPSTALRVDVPSSAPVGARQAKSR